MKYKRLTHRNADGKVPFEIGTPFLLMCASRLADLEDKIENGTLVDFPCKRKATIYNIEKNCDGCPYAHFGYDDFYCDKEGYFCNNDIVDDECKKRFVINKSEFNFNSRNSIYGTPQYKKGVDETNYEFTYFLDKQQAEQKLKELQGESK